MVSDFITAQTLIIAGSLLSVFVFSVIITWLVRRYAIRHAIIDVPNERSSHTVPTPRGGGLSISLSVLIAVVVLASAGYLPVKFAIGLGGGGLIVSITGWLDDHKHIPAFWRAFSYLLAAAWFLYWIDGAGMIEIGTVTYHPGMISNLLAILGITWLVNLYNFMDGSDGLAAVQAICTGLMAAMLFWISGGHGLAMISLVVVFASAGFLNWNWPPARIFMGDVGSCLTGFIFAGLAVYGDKSSEVSWVIWFILLSVFIMDATLTLLKRMLTGEQWYSAHRGHAYQRVIQLGVSHSLLAKAVLLINLCLLWPAACVAWLWHSLSIYMAILVIIIMFVLWSFVQIRYHRLKGTAS